MNDILWENIFAVYNRQRYLSFKMDINKTDFMCLIFILRAYQENSRLEKGLGHMQLNLEP